MPCLSYDYMMELKLPAPPPDVIQLRDLEDRWGEVSDWSWIATSQAVEMRSKGFQRAMSCVDLGSRMTEFMRIEQGYHSRLNEIDETLLGFKEAYQTVKDTLDKEAILTYAEIIRPMLKSHEDAIKAAEGPAWKRLVEQREIAAQEREERKAQRQAKKLRRQGGKIDRGNRDIPQTDRSAQAIDEGAGGGASSKD